MSVLASSRPTHRGSGRATPQKSKSVHINLLLLSSDLKTSAGSAPLTAANLATHHASGIGRAPSESSTSSRTSSTMSYLGDLDEDEFNQYLDDLRANRHATIARLRANARAAHGRAPGIPSGDTDPSSSSNNTGIDTPSGSADTPAGSADTPSESSDDSSSTITSTPTESTERGETFGQKLAKYLLSEGHGGEVSNLRGWQELCLASGAVVGKDRTTCREVCLDRSLPTRTGES
jgi:hypothetical protein